MCVGGGGGGGGVCVCFVFLCVIYLSNYRHFKHINMHLYQVNRIRWIMHIKMTFKYIFFLLL